MKRLIALVIALMLCAMPALAELWYTDDILEDGSPIYYFEELSLTLPADWAGKVMANEEDSGTAFYQKASYDAYKAEGIDGGGFLFRLCASVNGSFSQLPAFEYLGFSEESAMNYYLELPSDYPAYMGDNVIRAEYDAMLAEIDFVVSHAAFYQKDADNSGGGSTTDGTGYDAAEVEASAAANAEAAAPTLAQARYHYEHRSLPGLFYEDPEQLLDALEEVSFFGAWQAFANENGVEYPYTEEDYVKRWYSAGDATILQVTQPAPEESPQCLRVYFVYDWQTQTAGYYTVEYENLLGETALVCGWTSAGEHLDYGLSAPLDADEETLLAEARQIATLAGISAEVVATDGVETSSDDGLQVIECPELGFSVKADTGYFWDYQEGTGITIYTEGQGHIPYVIVWQSENLIAEPFEYIREQFTPYMQKKYGDDLVDYAEREDFVIGDKTLPAGLYIYRVQDQLVEMLRIYDSTSDRTVAYTAKYIQYGGDEEPDGSAEIQALDTAIRTFQAD